MSHIFISYSHDDSDYAHKLEGELKRRGFEVWIDERIDYGTRWPQVIEEHLDRAGALILIMTPRAKDSNWVQNELARAQDKDKPVFPLLLEGDTWLAVQATQYVEVRAGQLPPERFYDRLARVVPRHTVVLRSPEDTQPGDSIPASTESRKDTHQTARKVRPAWTWVVGTVLALAILGGSSWAIRSALQDRPTLNPTPLPSQTCAVATIYRVQVGDTLVEIAKRHCVGLQELMRSNNILDPNRIYPGQRLLIPQESTETLRTPTEKPQVGATRVREKDGAVMVYVPAGEFWMGSTDEDVSAVLAECSGCEDWIRDEQPTKRLAVNAFWIDRTEVTNAQYRACVDAEACSPPRESKSRTRENYYGTPEYDDYPVIRVTWQQAREYAAWVGGRLPTETEWEYACRGPGTYAYPWGDSPPDDTLLNYGNEEGDTKPAGSYPEGKSWCGALDMAGNVWEWTQSLYQRYPYVPSDGREDPSAWGDRTGRGGAFDEGAVIVRCAFRHGNKPDGPYANLGFRVSVPTQQE